MALHNPPKHRYLLIERWDKDTFALIKQLAKTRKYPSINGAQEDRNRFLTTLIRTQKSLHDWRDFPKDVIKQIQENQQIDVVSLNNKYPPESIAKDVPTWVTYEEDKIVSNFIDELETKKIDFIGTNEEIVELILRFILGQLGHDWEQTIMMIWEILGDNDELRIRDINKELKSFDYCKLFD